MPIEKNDLHTVGELQRRIGHRIQSLRLTRNLTQADVAAKGGVSHRSVVNLETGSGSSIETLVRILKALNAEASLDALAPAPTVSPLALLRSHKAPRRASKPRGNSPGGR
jgi:transcriptional regulator with XRE-family HTH domain